MAQPNIPLTRTRKSWKWYQQDLELIFGRENVTLATTLVDPGRLDRFIASANAVGAAQLDETSRIGQRMGEVLAANPLASVREVERQAMAQTQAARRGDLTALSAGAARAVVERTLQAARERGEVSAAQMAAIVQDGGGDMFDRLIAEGFSPAEAAVIVERAARTDVFDFSDGVDVDLSSAVLSELGSEAFRSTGVSIRPGAVSRANASWGVARFLAATGLFADRAAPTSAEVERELQREAERLNVTIIGQQYNATPPPGQTDSGRRGEGVAD